MPVDVFENPNKDDKTGPKEEKATKVGKLPFL
jgi:hypothetical protein